MKLIRYEYPQSLGNSALDSFLGSSAQARFGALFEDFFGAAPAASQTAADLYEDEHNYYARLELPGVKKADIDLELENAVLTISSSQADGAQQCAFQRSLSIPDGVALEKVNARHEDGILTVTMPKEEARKPRQIKVK
ncbi:MAG TPA: hypothetical protein DCX06_01035 [Opitutae bacterium]|nr:hypothetical protein [Opitutae bacterium]